MPDRTEIDFEKMAVRSRDAIEALEKFGEKLREAREGGALGRAITGAAPPAAAAGGAAAAGLGDAFAALKTGALAAYGALAALPAQIKPFVEALNPSILETFNEAVRSVYATIGQAFEGIFAILTGVLQTVADMIAPLFEALRPVIDALVADMASRLLPVLALLTEVAIALIPAFEILNEAMRPLQALLPAFANYLRLVVAVWVGIFQSLGDVLSPLRDWTDNVVDAMKAAVRWLIVFAAQLAKFFGLSKIVESIQKTFAGPKEGQRKIGAAQAGGVSDMASILREATAAAFTAQGGAETKGVEDWLKGIDTQLADGLKAVEGFEKRLQDMAARLLKDLFPELARNVEFMKKFSEWLQRRIENPLPESVQGPANVGTNALRLVTGKAPRI